MSAGIIIISDLTFAIMPMFVIWKLNRPLLERILVSILMALGLCATSTVIVKVCSMKKMVIEDTYREMLTMFMWCRIEECILISSACAPFLKSLIERVLGQLGMPSFRNTTRELNSFHSAGRTPNVNTDHQTLTIRDRSERSSTSACNIIIEGNKGPQANKTAVEDVASTNKESSTIVT
jgi:hypothetical protein